MNRIGKRIISSIIIMLMLLSMLSGCGEEVTVKNQKKTDSDKIQIGMCFDSFVIERWQRDRDVFVSTAKELGADVNVQNANGDVEEQKKQIEYFIKKKMDIIVIVSIDADAIASSVEKAKDQGIKVVAYDRPIPNADVDLYVSFDNELVGQLIAEAFLKSGLKNNKVLMLCGPLTDNNVPMVEAGFLNVMEENNVEVVDIFHVDGWKAELASDYVFDNMETIEQVDAIMCGNDDLASKVVYALSEKRLAKKKLVAGQDADLEACQRIVEGTQLMTVYKPIEKLAREAAGAAVALAKGEEIDESKLSTYTSEKGEVPYLKIEPVSVTQDNMDSVIIKSGFHLKEDVYLNVPGKSAD